MIGDSKPNFALDLSNEGVAVWHRSSGGGWSTLGSVSLSDADFADQLAALRDSVAKGAGRARRAVIRIPRSEVLLSKVRVGVFEGEAAVRHAQKQIAELSPLDMADISFDLGEKGVSNMAPVGIVARQTLIEADAFARSNGFEPLYFTTQYAEREFNREPKFVLDQAAPAAKPLWFVPWVAAASVGLAAGYFGFAYFTTPDTELPIESAAVVEQSDEPVAEPVSVAEPVAEPIEQETPRVDTTQLGLQDVAPALPTVAALIEAPAVTEYPEMRVSSIKLGSNLTTPEVTRLRPATADQPTISVSSKQVKTNDLQIAEARRDLPNVAVNAEIVTLLQDAMTIGPMNAPEQAEPIQLASLTDPSERLDPALINQLPRGITTGTGVDDDTTKPAARPVRPPSTITAEPGTLIPTVEGTPGPDYITIFAGRPANEPRNRVDPLPPELELAGFRPRLRPSDLNVPAELLAAAVEPTEDADPAAEPTILDLADPALRPLRARLRPDTLVVPETETVIAADETPETVDETPSILALADPALRPLRARLRPAALSDRAAVVAEQNELAALGDPALRGLRARIRPADLNIPVAEITASVETETNDNAAQTDSTEIAALVASAIEEATPETPDTTDEIAAAIAQDTIVQAIQEDTSVLALADPSLSGLRARVRPSSLRIITPEERTSLLALADPTLAGKRTRARPSNLRILQPDPEPEVEQPEEAAAEETPVIRGTKQAVAISPMPKVRPARLARVVQRVTREARRTNAAVQNDGGASGVSTSGGATRGTARLPKSARGTVKSAPPTSATVARAATEKSRFKKSRMSLVGIFGAPNKRRALIRLPSGKYVKVQNGDKVGGWKVSAIGEGSLRIKKGSRDQVLRIP
ncbi:hypothetical protein [Amylibacter sp. IMCC11727]|uniref:hypothetical protein n=1 Tax=Amylibacter sp. IMCC11727 TaxID=3039851 RepID=UPI00244E4FCB|nr:hypothetical protein [Amylibacter sp. IMCC11727]WGI20602.1 hypothetical protein QBD29_10795 [Amylibacter sp. IMCC11727]